MHVCFVALKAFPALAGGAIDGQIGGAEVQQVLLARGLLSLGHRVSFILYDRPAGLPREIDDIRLFPAFKPEAGLPVLRFLHPRWTGLHRAMQRAAADVYYQRGAGCETGQVGWFRSANPQSRFIFAVGSDTDCQRDLPYLRSAREKMLFRYGLTAADRIIVQTESQLALLAASFNRKGALIRSIPPQVDRDDRPRRSPQSPPRILWVGRIAYEKRPDWLLELAAWRPQWRFDLVGAANSSSAYARDIRSRAAGLPNVKLHGALPHDQLGAHYDAADLLFCTSAWEGFPNTFLEAWARSLPTASTVDPDDTISLFGLGVTAKTVEGLVAQMEKLLADATDYRAAAIRCREYVNTVHCSHCILGEYERALHELCAVSANTQGDMTACAASPESA